MITHAEIHATCPLPDFSIPAEYRRHIFLNPVGPLEPVLTEARKRAGGKPRPRKGRAGGTLQEYLDKRERNRDAIRASIQDALDGSPPLSVSTIGDMLDLHRCKVLPHLKFLEEAGIVKHKGAQNKTRWCLAKR